jgi:hypothetical protein
MRSRMVARLRTRPAAFALAVIALLLIGGGVAGDVWMLTVPSRVPAPCTESSATVTYITPDGTYCMSPNPVIQPWLGVLVSALGVCLLVAAWKFDRRPLERPRQGLKALRSWGAPLLWLALLPILAAPIGYVVLDLEVSKPACQISNGWFTSTAECPVSSILPSVLIPGLLSLLPFRWLWTTDLRTRIAAITASALGVAGLTGSIWMLFAEGPTIEVDSGFILPPLPPPGQSGLALATVIWLSALIALLVIAKLGLGKPDYTAQAEMHASGPATQSSRAS